MIKGDFGVPENSNSVIFVVQRTNMTDDDGNTIVVP